MRRIGKTVIRLGDLLEVPPVRTVVQVADLADHARRRELVAEFVLTGDAERALAAVLEAVASGRGRGFFVQGNYGSGKSHLLTVLSLALSEPAALEELAAKEPAGALAALAPRLRPGRYLVVAVSLVDHPAAAGLEQILLQALLAAWEAAGAGRVPHAAFLPDRERLARLLAPYADDVEAFAAEKSLAGSEEVLRSPALLEELFSRLGLPLALRLDRRALFSAFKQDLEEKGLAGALFLIDELSEFLRSKPDGRSFNEDVRFLQFLGEEAAHLPAWVVATLQENIEGTGQIPAGVYNKIKDRYPVRLHLTGEHLKELIRRRLVRPRPEAAEKLAGLQAELRRAFGRLPWSAEEWTSLYPVHPATVRFLTELRPLFSQHRGVVDFVHFRLRGDPARGIPALLEEPWGTFLTPDLIFDHFRDRLRETAETNPYVDLVYAYYEREGENLFPDPEERELALRLVKLLILAAAAPNPLRLTGREMAQCLLHRFSAFEPAANYELVAAVLERLVNRGAYVTCEPAEEGGTLDSVYRLDLEADVHGLLAGQVRQEVSRLFPDDPRLVTAFLPWLDRPYLPLAVLADKAWYRQRVTWQGTTREVLVVFRALGEVGEEEVAALASELERSEADVVLFLDYPLAPEESLARWENTVAPLLVSRGLGCAALLWLPTAPEDREWLKETLGYLLLRERYAEDATARGKKAADYLEAVLAERRARAEQIFRQAYFGGRILDARGETVLSPGGLGYPPFADLLGRAVAPLLQQRFPRHAEIAPQTEAVTTAAQQRALLEFLLPGEAKRNPDAELRLVLDAVLVPLKLARRTEKEYRLVLDERQSPILRELLQALAGGEAAADELYWRLRKGPFGLTYTCFRLLVLALAAAGVVRLVAGGRRLEPGQLAVGLFGRVEKVVLGELLSPADQELLAGITWLPPALRRPPLTYEKQERLWQHLLSYKDDALREAEEIRRALGGLPDLPQRAGLLREVDAYAALLGAIDATAGAEAGLERFLRSYAAAPAWDERRERHARLKAFCAAGRPEQLAARLRYLDELTLPTGGAYADLAARRAELRSFLAGEEVVFDAFAWQRGEEAWEAFRRAYSEAYRKEHAAERGRERFRDHRELQGSALLAALAAFSRVQVLNVSPDFLQVKEALDAALKPLCPEDPPLASRPVCGCGFRLGERAEVRPAEEIAALARESLRRYLAALGAQAAKVEAYAAEAARIGRQRVAVALRQLLGLAAGEPDPAALAALLDEEVVAALREALAGRALIVRRSLRDLERRLAGRTFTAEGLRRLVEEWLAASELAPGTYIEVVGGNDSVEEA